MRQQNIQRVSILDKAVVLLDGGYLDKINQLHFGKMKLDLLKLSDELCKPDCQRFRTYYYNCPPYQSKPPTEPEKKWLQGYRRYVSRLDKLPRFTIREGFLKMGSNGVPSQKLVDVWFACDLVRMCTSTRIDQAIIIAGDSDFVPAVNIANEEHVITKLLYYPGSCAPTLFDACDERVPITKDLFDCCIR